MKNLLFTLFLLLAACGGSDNTTTAAPKDDDSQYATVTALKQATADLKAAESEITALNKSLTTVNGSLTDASATITAQQAQLDTLQKAIDKIQLIGSVHGKTVARTMAATQATTVSFGPCTDMGVEVGSTVNASALDEATQAFKQCTGYYYEVDVDTGNLHTASREYFDGANCTGNEWEFPSGTGAYDRQKLSGGIVFIDPLDGQAKEVQSGQTPQAVSVLSSFVVGSGCQPVSAVIDVYAVTSNDVNVTGVPLSVGSDYQLTAP